MPQRYQLEGDVEDVSRQHIANRASVLVHPASFYVGVKALPYFTPQKTGLQTEIIAVGLDGKPVSGIPVEITLTQTAVEERAPRGRRRLLHVGHRARRDSERHLERSRRREQPVPLQAAIATGGYFRLEAQRHRR